MIIEIDGPPMAYFIDKEEINQYKTIAVMGKEAGDIVVAMNEAIETIRATLGDGIIYWRLRPSFTDVDQREIHGKYKIWCRVTTSPPLSREFWDDLLYVKEEGADFVNLDEVKP